MSYTRKVVEGVAVVFLASVLTNLFGYLLRLYLGRTLTTAEFGLVYGIMALFGIVATFIYLGLNEAVVKFLSDARAKGKDKDVAAISSGVLTFELLMSLAVCGVAVLAAPWLASAYFKAPDALVPIMLYALAIGVSPLLVMASTIFQAYQRPRAYASMGIAQAFGLLALTWAIFRLRPSPTGVMLAYLTYYLVALLVFIPLARRVAHGFRFRVSGKNWIVFRKVFAYSIPITLTTLSYALLSHTDTLMITYYRSLDEVGLYNAALPTANILLFFATSVATVFLPIVAELWTKRKKALLQDALAQAYVLLGAAIVPGAMLFVAFPDIIINLLFGAAFLQGASALRALSFTSILTTFSLFNGAVLAGIGSPKKMARAVAFGAVVNVVMNALLIPRIGFLGAAIATLISSVIIFVASTYAVREGIESRFPFVKWWLTLLSGGVLLALVAWMRQGIALPLWWKLAVILPVGGVVYATCLWGFRVITPGEVKALAARLFRRE